MTATTQARRHGRDDTPGALRADEARRAHPGLRRGRGGRRARTSSPSWKEREECSAPPTACSASSASARCYNTPLAEANIIGRGIGQAMRGLRPCAEIQFFDYIWPAMMQIRSEAATMRWRSEGRFTVPSGDPGRDRRLPHRGGHLALPMRRVDLHPHPGSDRRHASRSSDAAGLLRTAFRCEDPVLFLEHKHLLRQKYARGPADASRVPDPARQGLDGPPGRGPDDRDLGSDGAKVAGCRRAARRRRT